MKSRSEYLLEKYYHVDKDVIGNYDMLLKASYEKGSMEYADNTLLMMRCELLMGKSLILKTHFDEAMEIYERNSDLIGKFFALLTYAISLRNLGKVLEAANILNRVYEISFDLPDFKLIEDVLIRKMCSASKEYSVDIDNLELKQKTLELEENLRWFNLISEVGKNLASITEEEQIFKFLVDTIYGNIDADFIGLFLVDEERKVVTIKYTIEKTLKQCPCYEVGFDNVEAFSAYCAKERKDLFISDVDKEAGKYLKSLTFSTIMEDKQDIQSIIYCQLINEDELIGLLTVQSSKKNAYDKMVYETIKSIAAYSAIAISNANNRRLLKEKTLELEKLSYYDSLTGIKNRRSFIEYTSNLEKKIKSFDLVNIIVADMNHLKTINDNLGHMEGDKYLSELANILIEYSNDYEIFRLSGDEFGIITLNAKKNEIEEYISKVKAACADKEYDLYPISVAMGYSTSKEFNLKKLFKEAELNMYEDKNAYYNKNDVDRRKHN